MVNSHDRVTHYVATLNDLSAKKALQKKIIHLGFTDSLTGLKNCSALLISLQRTIDENREQQSYAAVLVVDIDGLKSQNLRLGHLAGDVLLQQSARRINQALVSNVAVTRLFADRFVLVLEELGGTLGDPASNKQRLATCDLRAKLLFRKIRYQHLLGTNILKHRSLPGWHARDYLHRCLDRPR